MSNTVLVYRKSQTSIRLTFGVIFEPFSTEKGFILQTLRNCTTNLVGRITYSRGPIHFSRTSTHTHCQSNL